MLAAGQAEPTSKLLGQMRLTIARRDRLVRTDRFEFAWIVEFPLVEWHEEDHRWFSVNHPFTAPMDEDRHLLEGDPGAFGPGVRHHPERVGDRRGQHPNPRHGRAAVRVHQAAGYREGGGPGAVRLLPGRARVRHPAPRRDRPGARSVDRAAGGETSIRETIAFPKTAAAEDLMTGAPSPVRCQAAARADPPNAPGRA